MVQHARDETVTLSVCTFLLPPTFPYMDNVTMYIPRTAAAITARYPLTHPRQPPPTLLLA